MIDYRPLLQWLGEQPLLRRWAASLPEQIADGLSAARWGDLPQWQTVLDSLPDLHPADTDLYNGVRIGREVDCDSQTRAQLRQSLMGLHPWRKGPVNLFGLHIDTEWRSDWKWQRLLPHIEPLSGRTVLDVGCGNGYYCLRMLGAGAARVIGIDPSAKFVFQFHALKRYLPDLAVDVLPLGIEQVPGRLHAFDTLFSMGVLYHRKDAEGHLVELKSCLRAGGQLVLETLVLDSDRNEVLVPRQRYAKMRNVWAIPSPARVLDWLNHAGFASARLVNMVQTGPDEQRRTEWMRFESLADYLDANNPQLTVEGYPAPVRAIFVAEAPRAP